jgi:hypothetical protein
VVRTTTPGRDPISTTITIMKTLTMYEGSGMELRAARVSAQNEGMISATGVGPTDAERVVTKSTTADSETMSHVPKCKVGVPCPGPLSA